MMLKLTQSRVLAIAALSALMACGNTPTETKKTEETNKSAPQKEQADGKVAMADDSTIDLKKVSQALGHFIGRNLKAPGINFDTESLIIGIREGSEGKPAPMSDEEYEKAMNALQQKALTTISATNLEAADKFLKENASVNGVVEIVPGKLQYTILAEGKDPSVPEGGTPLINYTGKYLDGTVFGTSDNAGGPIAVPIDQTIQGFSKGIKGMKEGEKRRLFVHPELGYGTSGQLPPNSLLIFDIEVVKTTAPSTDMSDNDDDILIEDEEIETEDDELNTSNKK